MNARRKAVYTQQRKLHLTSSAGLTFIELLMTLFVMAVLTAVVIPVASQVIVNMEARSFVRQLEADIAFAQKHAIATERPVMFYVNGPTGLYMIRELKDGSEQTIKAVYAPNHVSFTASSILHKMTFQPHVTFAGQSNGGTIYIKQNGEPFANVIVTLLSSRTRVEWQ